MTRRDRLDEGIVGDRLRSEDGGPAATGHDDPEAQATRTGAISAKSLRWLETTRGVRSLRPAQAPDHPGRRQRFDSVLTELAPIAPSPPPPLSPGRVRRHVT